MPMALGCGRDCTARAHEFADAAHWHEQKEPVVQGRERLKAFRHTNAHAIRAKWGNLPHRVL